LAPRDGCVPPTSQRRRARVELSLSHVSCASRLNLVDAAPASIAPMRNRCVQLRAPPVRPVAPPQ
jgi:hypothetical protein